MRVIGAISFFDVRDLSKIKKQAVDIFEKKALRSTEHVVAQHLHQCLVQNEAVLLADHKKKR
ncbi:hypothetical protein HA38_20900 [Pantoea allii]|nr:hypothetical protein HA38_20900 [Pantoea allii]PBK01291.1 hypothetical protein CMR03_05605 [Pantoea allii]